MNPPLKFKKHLVKKLELGITFLLLLYYLAPNIPVPLTKVWALFGFLTVPLLVIGYWRQFIWVATKDILLLLLTGIAVISVLWSTSPGSTIATSRALLCSTAFGIYLATRYSPKEQMRLLVWLFSIYTVLNLILPIIIPSYAIDSGGAWTGIAKHKNELSAAMSMASTLFFNFAFYSRRYRWAALIGAILAFLVLILSRGKGSLGMFIALFPLFPLYKIAQQKYRLKTFLGICASIIVGIMVTVTLANLEFIVVDLLGKSMELNARTPLWTYLIERGLERPWLGYGYAGFWTNPEEGLGVALAFPWLEKAAQGAGNAHSAYMDLFLQLGWLGILLVILSFVTVLVRTILLLGLSKQIEYLWMLQCLLILSINSFYESYGGFLAYRHLFWILYVSHAYTSAFHLNRIMKTGNKLVNIQAEKSLERKSIH